MKFIPVLVLGGLVAAGCSAHYADEGNATRVLLVTGVNGGNVLESDVRQATATESNICPNTVPVRVENHPKNPNAPTAGFRDDIVIERYEVRYYRSDGRGVEAGRLAQRIEAVRLSDRVRLGDHCGVVIRCRGGRRGRLRLNLRLGLRLRGRERRDGAPGVGLDGELSCGGRSLEAVLGVRNHEVASRSGARFPPAPPRPSRRRQTELRRAREVRATGAATGPDPAPRL